MFLIAELRTTETVVLLTACALLFISSFLVAAYPQASQSSCQKTVSGTSSKQELLRRIFPDLDKNHTAHASVQIRNLHGDYDPDKLSGTMNIMTYVPPLFVRNEGRRDAVLVADIEHKGGGGLSSWGGETILALYRLSPSIKLLDAVDIRQDRESGLWSQRPILHGQASDALFTCFSHLNAGEEFVGFEIIEIVHDKFVVSKASLPMLHSIRLGDTDVSESLTIRLSKNSKQHGTIVHLSATCKRFYEESDRVKKIETKYFDTRLFASKGHWHSVTDKARASGVAAMEVRYGFEGN